MSQFFPQKRLTLSTLILAGGQSRRMGQDKALIKVRGKPLIQYLCRVAQKSTDRVYIVTPWGDRYRSVLPSDCIVIPEPSVEENSPSAGPLTGFLQGLPHITTDWCLLLACDLPNLTSAAIDQWSNYLPQVADAVIALLPRHAKGWDPLCGFYRPRCLASGQQFVQQGGRSFQQWLKKERVAPLNVGNPHFLFNCNTPEDLEQLPPDSPNTNFILQ